MISGSRNRRFRLIVLAFAAFATVATGVAGLLVLPSLERMMFTQAGQRDDATLRLASEALRGALRRFESAPARIWWRCWTPPLTRRWRTRSTSACA